MLHRVRCTTHHLGAALLLTACAASLEDQLWRTTQQADTIAAYQEFVEHYPSGLSADEARQRLEALYEAVSSLDTVRIEIDEAYMYGHADLEITNIHLPYTEAAARLLRYAGLTITNDSLAAAAGVLHVTMQGRALSQSYAPANERSLAAGSVTRQYAGANLRGALRLQTPAGTLYENTFVGLASPPDRIGTANFPRPRDAPFEIAFDNVFAAEVAHMMGHLFGAAPLVAIVEEDTSLALRGAAALALGDLGDPEVVPVLLQALAATANFDLKRATVIALGQIGDARAVAPVLDVLQNAFDVSLRESAAEALGRLGDAAAVEPLIEVLRRDAEPVRRQAAKSLRALTDARLGTDAEAWAAWWEQARKASTPH